MGNDGKWEFVGGIHPAFDRREHWEDDLDDDDVTDLTDGTTDFTAEADAVAATKVRTAEGGAEYHREPQVRKSGVMDGGVRSSVLGGELW